MILLLRIRHDRAISNLLPMPRPWPGGGWGLIRPDMITVRQALAEDGEGVERVVASAMALLRKVYRPGPGAMAARSGLAGRLRRLVAVADGEVVGTVRYHFDGDVVGVIGLMVRQDWQRKGVGRLLVARLEEIARDHQRQTLRARTIKETGNVPIFQSWGFSTVREQPDTLFVSEVVPVLTEVELEKRLVADGG